MSEQNKEITVPYDNLVYLIWVPENSFMAGDFTTFIELLSIIDFDAYVPLPEPHKETFHTLKQLRKLGYDGNNDILIQEISNRDQVDLIRVFAASVIHEETISREQVQLLGNLFLRERKPAVRIALAQKFELIPLDETIPYLIRALIDSNDPQFRAVVAKAIHTARAPMDWKQKIDVVMKAIADPGYFSEYLDMAALVTAVSPPIEQRQLLQNRYLLADRLISEAANQNSRRKSEIIAALLIESCGRQSHIVSDRINQHIATNHDIRGSLKTLQTAINAFLIPRDLQGILAENHLQPLKELQQEIQKKWQFSIFSAHVSLWTKISISILVSLGALIMLIIGAFKLFDQSQWPEGFLSIALGLVFLLVSIIYSGPISESHKNLEEIGVANLAYATFAQRSSTITNSYTRHYLQNDITLTEVEELSKLLGEAMKDSVRILRGTQPTALDELLAQDS